MNMICPTLLWIASIRLLFSTHISRRSLGCWWVLFAADRFYTFASTSTPTPHYHISYTHSYNDRPVGRSVTSPSRCFTIQPKKKTKKTISAPPLRTNTLSRTWRIKKAAPSHTVSLKSKKSQALFYHTRGADQHNQLRSVGSQPHSRPCRGSSRKSSLSLLHGNRRLCHVRSWGAYCDW